MSEMRCLSCGAETNNGLALCGLCQRKAATVLEFLPVYFANLARWRPGRAGSRPIPGSRAPHGTCTADDRISRALDEAGNALTTWARKLAEDRVLTLPAGDTEAEEVTAVCQWLTEHLTSIATLEWCGEFLRDSEDDDGEPAGISYHERRLRLLTEAVAPGWYAGSCRRCGVPTHVIPGFTWVTCDGCGATTYARDHLDTILDEARQWVGTPKQLAQVFVAVLDSEMSVESLRKRIAIWGKRNQLQVHRPNDYAVKRYAFGEVFDLLARKGPTRTDLTADEVEAC